jgi:two-component system NtrC family response regulator
LFREDLFYRLSEITVRISPLRDRQGDRSLLAHAFLEKFNRSQARSLRGFSTEAMDTIESHDWPGNVREIEHSIKRAVIMAEGSQITPADLGLEAGSVGDEHLNLRQIREEAERGAVVKALSRSNGNLAQTAALLGIARPTLYDLMNQLGLK